MGGIMSTAIALYGRFMSDITEYYKPAWLLMKPTVKVSHESGPVTPEQQSDHIVGHTTLLH